jgi:hypothetical protein
MNTMPHLVLSAGKREAKLLDTADQLSAKNHGAMVMVDEGKGGPDDGYVRAPCYHMPLTSKTTGPHIEKTWPFHSFVFVM